MRVPYLLRLLQDGATEGRRSPLGLTSGVQVVEAFDQLEELILSTARMKFIGVKLTYATR